MARPWPSIWRAPAPAGAARRYRVPERFPARRAHRPGFLPAPAPSLAQARDMRVLRAGPAAWPACLRPAMDWRDASAVPRVGDGLGALYADAALRRCQALQRLGRVRPSAQFGGF